MWDVLYLTFSRFVWPLPSLRVALQPNFSAKSESFAASFFKLEVEKSHSENTLPKVFSEDNINCIYTVRHLVVSTPLVRKDQVIYVKSFPGNLDDFATYDVCWYRRRYRLQLCDELAGLLQPCWFQAHAHVRGAICIRLTYCSSPAVCSGAPGSSGTLDPPCH